MTALLIKLSLTWAFSALLYVLLLRKETFFNANRAYLLGTLILGVVVAVLPGDQIPMPLDASGNPVFMLPVFTTGMQEVGFMANQWQNLDFLWVLYWVGFTIAVSRLLLGLFRLAIMIREGQVERLPNGSRLIRSSKARMPFSFFHWIFIPPAVLHEYNHSTHQFDAQTIAAMIVHEHAHARGWHSVDVLLGEILCVVFWFHPLAYWYKRALRAVHEYLADAAASRHSDKKQYGLLLIGQSQSGMPIAFAIHFFQSPLKQRLVMLTKKTSSPVRAIKFGLAIPLALLFALLFHQTPVMAQTDKAKPSTDPGKDAPSELSAVEKMPEYPGGQTEMMHFLGANIQYPAAAHKAKAEGMAVIQFVVEKDGALSTFETLKSPRTDFADEAIRVLKLMPKFSPAIKGGNPVRVLYTLPVKFKLS